MKNCERRVLSIVQKQPHTLTGLSRKTECSTETVLKYVNKLLQNGILKERKTKYSIFYNPTLDSQKVDFYELLLNSTNKLVVLSLLHTKESTQAQLESDTGKSRPSVSRSINQLIQNKIITREYYVGKNTYHISDKPKIISWLKHTWPELLDRLTDNSVEMFNH